MELFRKLAIVVIIVVALTDTIIFYVMQRRHMHMTWPLLVGTIIITILPIAIQLRLKLVYKGK